MKSNPSDSDNDQLAPARGVFWGVVLGSLFWLIVILVAWWLLH